MLPCAVRPQTSDMQLFPELEPLEIEELREWFCHVKPIGSSVKITVTADLNGHGFCVATAGNDAGPIEKIVYKIRRVT